MLFITLMNLCFAAALPLLKIALQYTDPVSLVTVRMLAGGLVLIVYALCTERLPKFHKIPWMLLCKAALFEVYLLCLGEAWALDRMSAVQASIIWSLLPLLTAFCVRICQSENITRLQWIAILIAMTGAGILPCIGMLPDIGCAWWHGGYPQLVMIGAVCAAAYGYVVLKQLVDAMQSVVFLSGMMMLIGGLGTMVTGWVVQGSLYPLYRACVLPELWLIMVLIVVLENIIALTLQTFLMRSYSATFLALTSFITPVFGLLIGVWFLREPWYHSYGVALMCIFVGVVLFYRQENDQHIEKLLQ